MTTAMTTALACANCGASLGGAYCHVCGQKAVSSDVSLHDFAHEAMHEFGHLDGKIVRTLRLLVAKPGMLTREFLDGRRSRYISRYPRISPPPPCPFPSHHWPPPPPSPS